MVSVFIPEYVVGHWYEHLLHNQSALRLKGRLLFTPGVMVTSCRTSWSPPSGQAAGPQAAPTGARPGPCGAARSGASRPRGDRRARTQPVGADGRRPAGRRLAAARSPAT